MTTNDENALRAMYQKQRSGRRIRHRGSVWLQKDCVLGRPPATLTGSPFRAQVLNYKAPEKSFTTVLPFHKIKIKVKNPSLMVVTAVYLRAAA